MTLSVNSLAAIAVDIQDSLSRPDRFQRIINSLHSLLNCDATALLRYEAHQFRPLATAGLAPDVIGRRFKLDSHPRLEAIARAGNVVRFPADSDLPDPYDGLIPEQPALHVHACVGLPLFLGQTLIGALTLDGMDAAQFDAYSDEELWVVGTLVSGALNNALLMEQLEKPGVETFSLIPLEAMDAAEDEMIGNSAQLLQLKKEIGIVASTDLSVLITGETGVGKELVAQALHRQSARSGNPLIYLNCAALPETVAESELFGHVKGAFTGAVHDRTGKFEMADRGTLFLDEIGELPLSLQAKLLRVLQYGDLQRVGEDRLLKVDVRILAATNQALRQAVAEGRFRADLYHRLSVFPLHVPALRERGEDIVLLAGYFCEKCRRKFGLQHLALSAAARTLLTSLPWSGNIRELEHSIYRASIIAQAEAASGEVILMPSHFSPAPENHVTQDISEAPLMTEHGLRESTDEFQRQLIARALKACEGNWAACARKLEVDAGNLHRLAARLGLK
ncbi:nitric oxide reductase transcriptional regulator NorR [Pantoea sp. BAV 3049]|uniref:nitric oxide reductase transcriptional regulator NorR n=1 Tax=Pantoea sp. BAV 3049 TaxID=2654188 RepID=UPI00131B83C5|nr:nitric oxide reductase transcriptional regulator NorR [Pantoea sp. BAV 3049]